ncbi:hypothetical protein GCM10023144_00590 [Pigmentiphaga soli]|uniref:Hydantoin racemase n=1 Tax=Pigmentiphaga soli TaxID=1007095 RepID=A0ABP8GBU7_9BURK
MKIWYQSFTRQSLYPRYGQALRRLVDALREPGTTVDVHALEKTGGLATQHHYLEHLHLAEVLENVERAVEQGYDAFAIGHFTDSGLQEAREIAPIPVLGLGETSMHLACMMGRRFALVGLGPKSLDSVAQRVHAYGLDYRLAGTAAMAFDNPVALEAGFSDPAARDGIVRAFHEAAGAAVRAGAEVVIPAGGVAMAVLGAAGVHLTADGATVLNGIAALVRMCESAVRMDRWMGGHFTSKRLSYAPPSPAEMDSVRQFYGDGVYRSARR